MADSSGILFLLWAQMVLLQHKVLPVFVFCFWADVFIAMSVTQFWIAVNDVIAPFQAKRLVGLFVTGGLFGGIAGAAVAALASYFRPDRLQDLLLVCPVLLVLAVVTVNVVYAGQRKVDADAGNDRLAPSARVGYLESFRTVLRHRYLLLLAAMVASALVAGTLINYQFKTAVRHVFETDADRTSFVAAFLFVILAVSTVVHLFTSRRFLKAYGIGWAISLAPLALLFGAAAVFLIPVGLMLLWAVVPARRRQGFRQHPQPVRPRAPLHPRPGGRQVQGQDLHRHVRQQVRGRSRGRAVSHPAERPSLRVPRRPAPGADPGDRRPRPRLPGRLARADPARLPGVPGRPEAVHPEEMGPGRRSHHPARRCRPDPQDLQHHPEPGAEHDALSHEPLRPRPPEGADPRAQGPPRHQEGRDRGPGNGHPLRRRRRRPVPRPRGGHGRRRAPPRDRPRLPPAGVPGDHGRTPQRDRLLALRGRPDRGGQDHRPDGRQRPDPRGPGAASPGPVRRGRPVRPRERLPSTALPNTSR